MIRVLFVCHGNTGRRFGTGEDMCDEFYQRRCIQQFYENFFQEAAGGFAVNKS